MSFFSRDKACKISAILAEYTVHVDFLDHRAFSCRHVQVNRIAAKRLAVGHIAVLVHAGIDRSGHFLVINSIISVGHIGLSAFYREVHCHVKVFHIFHEDHLDVEYRTCRFGIDFIPLVFLIKFEGCTA